MKGKDKSQEIAKLKSEIEEREKDLFYADSWEQSGQIRADIEKMNAKLNTLINSEKGQENGKNPYLVLSKNIRRKISKSRKRVKKNQKKRRDKYMVGVVFRAAQALFLSIYLLLRLYNI